MSTVKSNNHQIGQSVTATNNFTWYQPASPDGTVRLGNGNSGSVTDLVTLTSAGNLGIGTSSPGAKLEASTSSASVVGKFSHTGSVLSGAVLIGDPSNAANSTSIYLRSTGANSINYASGGYLAFSSTGDGLTERMRLDSSGNLGLGVTPSAWRTDVSFKALQMPGGTFAAYVAGGLDPTPNISANAYVDSGGTWRYLNSRAASWYIQNGGMHAWYNAPSGTAGNAISFTQAMTLDASGNLLVGTTSQLQPGNVVGVANILNSVNNGAWALALQNNATTASWGRGLGIRNATDFNTTSSEFIYCVGNTNVKFVVMSNGGIYNFSANNVNLSDERVKTAITPAPSWLPKINAIEVVNFKYKDQTHDDFNLGVIAQQVLEVAPEIINEEGFGETPEDGVPLLSIYETDLMYGMLKAIQELSAELNELKQKVNA